MIMNETSENEAKLVAAAMPVLNWLEQLVSCGVNPALTESLINMMQTHVDMASNSIASESVSVGECHRTLAADALNTNPVAIIPVNCHESHRTAFEALSSHLSDIERRWPMASYHAMEGAGLMSRKHLSTSLKCLGYLDQFDKETDDSLS
jgi:hypothetical protein